MTVKFFKFSPGIPWKVNNKSIVPTVNRDVWKKVVSNHTTVLCPGYFFEVLLLPLFNKVLNKYGANVKNLIVPAYYTDLLKVFDITNTTVDESPNLFNEFNRLDEVSKLFPVPMFMDRENNVYFNMLFGYGRRCNVNGKFLERDNESCWKQILRNTCSYPYQLAYPYFDQNQIKERLTKLFESKNVNANKPYILIDNHNYTYKSADGRNIIPNSLLPHQIRTVSTIAWQNGKQVIVMGKEINYNTGNVFCLPESFSINSADLFALLLYADGIYSFDPNIYLSGALLGCSRIFAGGNFEKGFGLKDLQDITIKNNANKYWVEKNCFELSDIMKIML